MISMELLSIAFQHGEDIPSKYTCDGKNISPPLSISDVPAAARSLALLMDDPDAPGGTWDHWVVFNVPRDTNAIEEGEEPAGVGGKNSWKRIGYGGPCPPDREHRYFFKLYALDTMLDLSEGATKAEVEQAMVGYVMEEVVLMGRYNRQ